MNRKENDKGYNVLFVCHGNICRSPMAEFILKDMVKKAGREDFFIESAAVSREEIGNPIYPPAKRCLSEHGVPFDSGKTARQVVAADYERFDLIVCMDEWNVRLLKKIIPSDPSGKIRLMMSFAGINRDVADPWYTGDFEKTYQDLMVGCRALLEKLITKIT
ncbi:MAG: low molecular weight phosphotyrosine protein phosphatase [Bacteroidales bacterium]|nr:low molecular weight phosphotyrosine protein phosphatase [Bacteroidales bacterium]